MKNKNEEKVQPSLIPGIREQEGHLQAALQVVQQEAEKLLEDARREAKTSIEKARSEFSASVERLRVEGLRALKASLEAENEVAKTSIKQFEEQTCARMPEAVAQIMAIVLPEGKA